MASPVRDDIAPRLRQSLTALRVRSPIEAGEGGVVGDTGVGDIDMAVIAPSGAQYYTGKLFPEWRGNIFIGGLASQQLVRLVIKDNRVTGEEHLLTDRGQRIRDVRQGPDGALYVVTDQSDGELLKIAPKR